MNVKPLLGLLVLAPLLAGCTSSPDVHDVQVTKQYRGVGQLLSNPTFDGTGAPVIYWLDASRKTVSLTTWGSGSCPSVPVGIRVASSTRVTTHEALRDDLTMLGQLGVFPPGPKVLVGMLVGKLSGSERRAVEATERAAAAA